MSEVTGFSLQYGNGQIIVEDSKKTLWFGDYHGGKLAIYQGTLELDEDTELMDTLTMVCVFYDASGNDFVMSSHYLSTLPMEDIITDLQTRVILKYHQAKAAQVTSVSTYVPGPDTLQ